MIRVLHTADWHIGQLFHEYDRTYEHHLFLEWLTETLMRESIDVLLISGDVFDLSNPSAASVKMFYAFLNQAVKNNPQLQIIVTAGNHDSPARLESPKPLLESSNIHIVGLIEKDTEGKTDFSKITIPLKNRDGNTEAWCIAAPFLRMGDYPSIPESSNPYAEGVTEFYAQAFAYADSVRDKGQAIIAMGHLHAQQAEVGDHDKMERLIMGGVESIPAGAFNSQIRYVALGHIHKAQRVGGKEHVRYCGSPLPMSFSEINYKHQAVVFSITGDRIEGLESIEIPVSVPLLRVPVSHTVIETLTPLLEQMEPYDGDLHVAPYLEVRVLLDGPEPGLRHKVETALTGKHYRLAKIDVRYRSSDSSANPDNEATGKTKPEQLNELKPVEVLQKVYLSKYNTPVSDTLLSLFRQVEQQVEEPGV